MTPERDTLLQRAERRAAAEPDVCQTMGVVLLLGFEAIAQQERFAGPGLKHEYTTHFPFGGAEWEFTIRKRDA